MHVTHLESALDGTRYDADQLQTTHRGRPLWVRYDLDAIGAQVDPSAFANRSPTMWRYHELLPAPTDDAIVSLGEGLSPVVPCPDLGAQFGLDDLWIKDEAQMPTGTFKSRGLSAAVMGAAETLSDEGWLAPDDHVVIFNCGAAQKYPQILDLDLPRLSPDASVDWDQRGS